MGDKEIEKLLKQVYMKEYDFESAWLPRPDSEQVAAELEDMLLDVMLYLRETGADTFAVLRNDRLNEWWGKQLKEIERKERRESARRSAKEKLTAEERRELGLDF